ncbi:MAG: hypothetical protein ABRQ25_17485 [Clostridiaceae bacterium]
MGKDGTAKIDDKVKFWEQQDRLYKAIVPKLLKDQDQDLINNVAEKISEYTDTIIRLEIKIQKLETEAKKYRKQKAVISILLAILITACAILSIIVAFS